MTRRFTIKKEIRSLGIDLCDPRWVVGVVVRGGLYLDGVVVFSPNPRKWNKSIADAVVRTRFYPELKLIMTHDPKQRLDMYQIERMTKLPVIEISATHSTRRTEFKMPRVGSKEVGARSTLEDKTAQEVLDRTWTTGVLPESLRVAHLIARSHFREKPRSFWANK